MIEKLQKAIVGESDALSNNQETVSILESLLLDAKEEKKMLTRQRTRELMRQPEKEDLINETYDELIEECEERIAGIENQLSLTNDKRNTIIKVNRVAVTAIDILGRILDKDHLDKNDLELIIEQIIVYEDHINVKLKDDIECILKSGTLPETMEDAANFNHDIIDIERDIGDKTCNDPFNIRIVQSSVKRKDKVYDVNVISNGDPLEIYTDREGEVIFKKYSPIGELAEFAAQYAETLYKTCGLAVAICDRDAVVACAGVPRKEFADKKLSSELESLSEERSLYTAGVGSEDITLTESGAGVVSCMMPIITEGDITGCVVSVKKADGDMLAAEIETKLIQTAAGFLGRQLES